MARTRGWFRQYLFTFDDKRHHSQRNNQRFGCARGNDDGTHTIDPTLFRHEHFAKDTRRRPPDSESN